MNRVHSASTPHRIASRRLTRAVTGIAQHSARLFEIRKRGFVVENQTERAADGRVLSRYWLRYDPERDGKQ